MVMTTELEYEPMAGTHIIGAAEELIAFAKSEARPAFMVFNGIRLLAYPSTTPEEISERFNEECARRSEAYRTSPAGIRAAEEQARREAKRQQEFADAIKDAPPMEFRDRDGWEKGLANNEDGYGRAVYRYAEHWARIMQKRIAQGEDVATAAERSQHVADNEGITGFMHGAAVGILCHAWKYGAELRAWRVSQGA